MLGATCPRCSRLDGRPRAGCARHLGWAGSQLSQAYGHATGCSTIVRRQRRQRRRGRRGKNSTERADVPPRRPAEVSPVVEVDRDRSTRIPPGFRNSSAARVADPVGRTLGPPSPARRPCRAVPCRARPATGNRRTGAGTRGASNGAATCSASRRSVVTDSPATPGRPGDNPLANARRATMPQCCSAPARSPGPAGRPA